MLMGRSINRSSPGMLWLYAMKWLGNVIRKKLMAFCLIFIDNANNDVLKNPSILGSRLMHWIINWSLDYSNIIHSPLLRWLVVRTWCLVCQSLVSSTYKWSILVDLETFGCWSIYLKRESNDIVERDASKTYIQ